MCLFTSIKDINNSFHAFACIPFRSLPFFFNYHLATHLLRMIVISIINTIRDFRTIFKSQTYDDTKRSQTELTTENMSHMDLLTVNDTAKLILFSAT